MTTEQIKWMVTHAPGFKASDALAGKDSYDYSRFDVIYKTSRSHIDHLHTWLLWPYFLQSIIEEIETRYSELGYTFHRQYKCSTCEWTMEVWLRGSVVYVSGRYDNVVDAKEAVVEWVYKRIME